MPTTVTIAFTQTGATAIEALGHLLRDAGACPRLASRGTMPPVGVDGAFFMAVPTWCAGAFSASFHEGCFRSLSPPGAAFRPTQQADRPSPEFTIASAKRARWLTSAGAAARVAGLCPAERQGESRWLLTLMTLALVVIARPRLSTVVFTLWSSLAPLGSTGWLIERTNSSGFIASLTATPGRELPDQRRRRRTVHCVMAERRRYPAMVR